MTKQDLEDYRMKINCQFCGGNIVPDKIRDHCHLSGKYRDPAHKNKCNKNVTKK